VSDRLFLAVALNDDVAHGLAAFITDETLRLPGRPTSPANWHVTVRFLGPTTALQRDRVLEFLDEHLAVEPFTMSFGGLGAFARPAKASVLYLGIELGVEGLAAMAEIAETAAQLAGFESEDRPFHAHITLSRIRPPMDVRSLIERVPRFPLAMNVDRLTLYRSHPGQDGPTYEVLDEVLL
jgi:RNA 2',3'-cyclic 3'-phosphodiesterase